MTIINNHPCIFFCIGLIWSTYQASRGIVFQCTFNRKVFPSKFWHIYLLCVAEGFTYFVCTASGFYALYLLSKQQSYEDSQTGITIFLATYGLLGITGKLPDILGKFKLPGS